MSAPQTPPPTAKLPTGSRPLPKHTLPSDPSLSHAHIDQSGLDDASPVQPNLPPPLLASVSELRSTGEIKLYYDRVISQFRRAFPTKSLPELHLRFEKTESRPFFSAASGSTCSLPPIMLGVSRQILQTLFIQTTPTFQASQQRLNDSTDCFYFTPERIQFVLAKALATNVLHLNSIWTNIKLSVLQLSSKRHQRMVERQEMKTDTMAAHFSPDIAIGGLEHLAKLNMYYENFQHDIPATDAAIAADIRLINLLYVTEQVHGIKKADALRLALNNRVTLSGNSFNLVRSVERILDSQDIRSYIKDNYPDVHKQVYLNETTSPVHIKEQLQSGAVY